MHFSFELLQSAFVLLGESRFFIPRQIIIFTYAPIPQAIGNFGVLGAMEVAKGCNWK